MPNQNALNTFQCIIVNGKSSDTQVTFVILHYATLEWPTADSTDSDSLPQVGFYRRKGNTVISEQLPNARTENVTMLTKLSNVGIPGKWIFRVDGNVEEPGKIVFPIMNMKGVITLLRQIVSPLI